jgi:hypothetical protein
MKEEKELDSRMSSEVAPDSSFILHPSSFPPRYPNRNAGFVFICISFFFTYVLLALLAIGLANNPGLGEARPFNWPFALGAFGVALILFVISVLVTRRLLQNDPRRVVLEAGRFSVEDDKGQRLAEIPYDRVVRLEEADTVLTEGQYNARYRGLLVTWQPGNSPGEPREFLLSARNTCDFEELMDDLFKRVPEEARGPRTFDR